MVAMRQLLHRISLSTRGKGLYAFTPQVRDWLATSGIRRGLLTLYVQHTSASLLIQENADPTVQTDLERFLSRLVPEGDPLYEHVLEGADDMPAHVRAALSRADAPRGRASAGRVGRLWHTRRSFQPSRALLPFELLVGLRYTHAKRRNHFISFISVVSMAGIALGVMALIVVLSVMNGFQEELRARILAWPRIWRSAGQATAWPIGAPYWRRRSGTRKWWPVRPT